MTKVDETPLEVRVGGVPVSRQLEQKVHAQLGRRIERYALNVTRVAVRFKDVNGPRGGVDTVCRIKMSMKGREHLVVEARATDAETAFAYASKVARIALGRALERKGPSKRRPLVGRAQVPRPSARRKQPKLPEAGSLIGRRVGRSRDRLQETWEWEGRGPTAARNVQLRPRRATVTLEDSATGRPSRKSTRKSANRQKAGSKQARKAKRAQRTPSARARRG
jgi:hypothetical protein